MSPKYSLNTTDLKAFSIKFLMAMGAAMLVYLSDNLKYIDFGQYQVFGGAAMFLVTYLIQRFFSGNK